ncbi:cell division protein ZipA [Parahalioglobus pacificus]|uniref:Cell division protein ZipA n=1 Tax=Parahalioglobus pacificus TaxID=930806 RepID=A0A918XG03_9GAMM|nr:cell division protein ZipA [Halioglobus pacificus]GHD28984.1 cell division protein ZipA [Halioglobus pacificus]
MDLTIRDWMVIAGVLLIFAVLIDAWRRVRSERYSRVKMKLSDPAPDDAAAADEDISWLKELPNGGARVVDRSDLLDAAAGFTSGAEAPAAQQASTDEAAVDEPESVDAPEPDIPEMADEPDDEVALVTGLSSDEPEPENIDWLDDMPASGPAKQSEKPEAGTLPRNIDPEVFMINVVTRDPTGFRGEDIMHILLACDLRFGDMDFFHRHEFEAGRGAIQFSVANMMQPGVFDLDNMAEFKTPGLVFFVTLPGPQDMMQAFDYMVETAQTVARNLGGDVLDETRSVMTRQTLEHCRQQIRDLERRMLAKAT